MGFFDAFRKRVKEVEDKAADALVDAEPEAPAPPPGRPKAKDPVAFKPVTPPTTPAPATSRPPVAKAPAAPLPPPASVARPAQAAPMAASTHDAGPRPAPPTDASAAPAAGGKRIDPARVKDILWDLELVLLEADVAMEVVTQVVADLEERLQTLRVSGRDEVQAAIESALKESIRNVLTVARFDFDAWLLGQSTRPLVIAFVGVNGTGKTTTIARLAHRLQGLGFGVVLAAGDTFRAGAIEQIEKHGERLGLRTIKHSPGSDPAAVAFDALEHAKARKKDVILLDTAGRMQTNRDLMDEIKKVKRVANPHLTIFVGDALAGNDAILQARAFDEAVQIDGVVLTKVDTDAKGGAALSIAKAVGKPVMFLGVGQRYEDLIPFDPDWLIRRLFEG